MTDQPARDLIANALDETMVVEAAAGTGKTTALVNRILRILATGRATVDSIVAVTFTEKAAGELKLRLRAALERARTAAADAAEQERLDRALGSLEEAHVSTIHGFCAELLRERPVEAEVDPLFTVLTEGQAERLFDEAFNTWLQNELADPPEGVRRALGRSSPFAAFAGLDDGPVDRLRGAAWELGEWRDFTAPWMRPAFDRDAAVDRLIAEVHDVAALTDAPSYVNDPLCLDTQPLRHLSREIASRGAFRLTADYDRWEARLVDLSRDRKFAKARHGRGPGYKAGMPRGRVVEALDALRANLDGFRLDADADLAAALQTELRGAVDAYEALKARQGALDFLDLLLEARNLVRGNALVRRGFQARFTHLFVDEFQDTDPLQAEILLLLAASDPAGTDWRAVRPAPGRLFIVGDPKQSIYRFRRADVGIYREVADRLKACGARAVQLTTSFRSVPGIQACLNAAFAPIMTGDPATLQADYVPLSPDRDDLPKQPAVVVLPVPAPYGIRNISAVSIEQSLPGAVGAFVEWLVTRSGWSVTERANEPPVPVAARHVAVLFRRFLSFGQDVTQGYVQALEARGVGHVLVGGKTFHDREEVETIRAALAAIEWPDDELSVFATLRGGFFAIGDEELLEWKHRLRAGRKHARFHPFHLIDDPPAHLRPIADALRLLRKWHQRRNDVPVADTIHAVVGATRAHVGLVLRSGGEQALANVLHVAELARQYEASGGISFRGFVEELRIAAERTQAAEAPVLEEGSDGVRMMTVHKAKGLEFPVVVLADLTCRLSRAEAGRWLDPANNRCALKLGGWAPRDLLLHDAEEAARDRAEAERLAYVAATRARDLLVIPAVGDGPYDGGWLDPLTPAIYPPATVRRTPSPAPGCPPFKSKDSVVKRPDDDPAKPDTVAPGLHAFPGHSVVWWDPHVLALDAKATLGLLRDDLIVKTGDLFGADERLASYERWRRDRDGAVEEASRPTVRVQTATSLAAEAARDGVDEALAAATATAQPVEILELSGAAGRPRGRVFGALVHAVLATVPLDASADLVRRVAETEQRILLASREETEAAIVVAIAVLADDVMGRARASACVRRECPITWLQPDGMLIEGVLDLAFDEGGHTVVVDFKTDHELSAGEARYRAQVQQYVKAVASATGRHARGILFKI